jgi:hypothetical protein
MATSAPSSSQSPFLAWLTARRVAVGTGLMAAGAAIAVLPTLLASWHGTDFLGTVMLTGLLALLVLAVGVSVRFLADSADPIRLLVLVVLLGGGAGLLIALTGVTLCYHWWNLLTDWISVGNREGAGQILLALVVLIGGLALMFVSLLPARAEERNSPSLRRLLYGYNAVFTGVLLLLILVVANVVVAKKYAAAMDATSSGEFSLSDRTVNMLKALDRPLHIYMIWDPNDIDRYDPIHALLDNFQDRSPQVTVQTIQPLQREPLDRLRTQYPRKIEGWGVLLVYGEEKPDNAVFVKEGDFFEGGLGEQSRRFRGEDKLVAALSNLEGGGQKTKVYFTQGEGEPSLTDTNPRSMEPALGVLKDRLNARGTFDVQPLSLTAADAKIPDDCKVLVVANPKAINPLVAQALRAYLIGRKGKAVFLTGVPMPPTGEKMPPTGAEALLAELDVELTADRIQSLGMERFGDSVQFSPSDGAIFEINPQARGNEIANAFSNLAIELRGVRLIRPGSGGRRQDLQAQSLLVTREGDPVWVEPKWDANPSDMVRGLARSEAAAVKRISREPLPMAVVVTEANKPRLALFGNTNFVTNRNAAEESGRVSTFSLFASTLDWLSERPTSIGLEPRNLAVYSMAPTANGIRMILLPGVLAIVAIFGLGLGVWVVRRR